MIFAIRSLYSVWDMILPNYLKAVALWISAVNVIAFFLSMASGINFYIINYYLHFEIFLSSFISNILGFVFQTYDITCHNTIRLLLSSEFEHCLYNPCVLALSCSTISKLSFSANEYIFFYIRKIFLGWSVFLNLYLF